MLALWMFFAPRVLAQQKMYWTDRLADEIHRSNLDGSDVQLVAFDLYGVFGVTIDPVDGKLYWTETGSHQIVQADLDGSNPRVIASGTESGWQLAVDTKHRKLYWTGGGKISRANMDGSEYEVIFEGDGSTAGIAIDTAAAKVYWSDTGIFERIRRANLDGTELEDLLYYPLYNFVKPDGFALDTKRGKMYWGDMYGGNGGSIHRANLDGTDIEDIVTTGIGSLMGLSIDMEAAKLYWTDSIGRKIKRSDLDGTSVETLVTQYVRWPAMIALDLRSKLTPVIATSPMHDASNVSTSPILEWAALSGAHEYVVQVFRDTTLSQSVRSDTTMETEHVFTAPSAETLFYWRVRGLQPGENGPWSDVRRFTTGSTGPLAAQPVFPEHHATDVTTAPTFEWNPAPEATRHRLQLASDSVFAVPILDTLLDVQSSLGPISLDYQRVYFWRIRGQTAAGEGTWSATRTFATRSLTLPAVPLVSPKDGDTGLSGLPNMTWTLVPGASTYHLQIANSDSFGSVAVEDSALVATTYKAVDPLSYSSTYYWRVRCRDNLAWGDWSEVWQFETGIGTGSETKPTLGDVRFDIYPNPTVGEATVRIETHRSTQAVITIWDTYGRLVQRFYDGRLARGSHLLSWHQAGLSAGVYLIRLDVDGASLTRNVVVVK